MLSITRTQFINLLQWALIIKQDVVSSGPDYLIEKFSKFIGDPKIIDNEPNKGLHPVLEGQVKIYLDYWKPQFKEDAVTAE